MDQKSTLCMIVFVATYLIGVHTQRISISINDVESNVFDDELEEYPNEFVNASKPYPPPNVSKVG